MKYISSIDGLRALAIGVVVASHFGAGSIIPGGFGVTLFFFISGYLITSLLIAEHAERGSVSIRLFYLRRFLRLAPALLTMIAVVSLTFFMLFAFVNGAQAWAGLFYYMNYYLLWGGSADMPLGPLWSLAVEEHYYVAFPLLFMLFWRWKERFVAGLLLSIVGVMLWRVFLVTSWHVSQDRTYIATDTRLDSIMYGAFLAGMLRTRFAPLAKRFDSWFVIGTASALLVLTFVIRNEVFRETVRYSLQGIALTPLFYSTLFSNRLHPMRVILGSSIFVSIGKLSYSIYLWHMPVLFFWSKLDLPGRTSLALAATAIAAAASYYGVERHFQRVRMRFRNEGLQQCSGSQNNNDLKLKSKTSGGGAANSTR